ncbi:sodium bile acid symporter family protein [Lentithecium fluviatile CBS 122367]|uniref:Sodium bile acid symporter family protein n=1 Tax=Lentithecium fluviatile CBS 122367 TaxID=1168545 RepID=A0A6G1JNH2_9PLEO|nr:sodium bile acid symporter family protein [Lentithecium fluviatile CBS 122367]
MQLPTAHPSEVSSKASIDDIPRDAIQPETCEVSAKKEPAYVEHKHASPVTNASRSEEHPQGAETGLTRLQEAVGMLKWFVRDQWFLIAMGFIILISSQVQVPDAHQRVKRTVITYLSVSVIFFVNGCTLSTRILFENYMRWKLHAFVQLQCYLVTSAATFGIVSLCATNRNFMDPWLLIGFLFIGTAPTTMSSNVVMTRQAHGNPALTVVQSIIGQFLCPFLTPILLQMYLSSGAWYSKVLARGDDNYGEIYRRVFQQLGLSLFIPMAIGQIVTNLFPKPTKKVFVDWKMSKLASIALLTLIWQTFDQAFRSGAFDTVKPSNIVFIIFISIALYFIWLGICFWSSIVWLPRKDTIACCYCCPAKALAMVVSVSSVMFINISPIEQSKIQIPAIIYQAFQVAIGSFLTILFRKWVKPLEDEEDREKEAEAPEAKKDGTVPGNVT